MIFRTHIATFLFLALLAGLVAGCGQKEIISAPVPTPVACVQRDQVPMEPERIGPQLNGDANHDLPIVGVSALDLRAWGGKLLALLTGCM